MATTETPTVKLIPHGKELALIIDPQLLRDLGIDENSRLRAIRDGQSLIIAPVGAGIDKARFEQVLAEMHERYGAVFKKLAE